MKCDIVRFRVIIRVGLVLLAFYSRDINAAVARNGVATPHTPLRIGHKYIPLHYGDRNDPTNGDSSFIDPTDTEINTYHSLAPSELILTAFRTILDVVRGINAKKKAVSKSTSLNSTNITLHKKNSTALESGRGFEDYYDEHHHHHHETTTTTTPKPMKQSRYTDPWAGYYDFIINEGSFKFWSAFQLFTTAVLFYACLSAIYYAKFNPIIPDYDREYDDYFLEKSAGRNARSLESWQLPSGLSWINSRTFQFILESISKNYET